jgi:hypothetical protein
VAWDAEADGLPVDRGHGGDAVGRRVNIVIHGLEVTHLWAWPYETIHHIAEAVAHAVPAAQGFVEWLVTAALDGRRALTEAR